MKLTIMVGVPGSGKSTKAKAMAQSEGNTILVSRDDIRAMLFPEIRYKFTSQKEKLVTEAENLTVTNALMMGKNVIVHDTNLKTIVRTRWQQMAKDCGAEYREVYVDCHIKDLLSRNLVRGNEALPVSRIWEMFEQYRRVRGWVPAIEKADPTKPKCVIFDVDGTLTKIGNRSPYDFSKVINDPPNLPVQELFRMYKAAGYACIVVSGRQGTLQCFNDTCESLVRTGVPLDDGIFMREEDDHRPDFDVKEQILLEKILDKFYPVLAVDDRDTPTGMWRMNGIPCFQVGYGDF
ncbi:polynucleotide kinase protein [Pantoea phage Phynn]|nr:polynucleotide kinase protein [Pantoea phage Phynn]